MIRLSQFWRFSRDKRILLIITSVIFLLSVIKSGYYTVTYGGVDLRNMTVAARMLDSGRVAYYYRWSPGQPEKYLNPNVHHFVSNAVSETPECLYFVSIFSSLPYPLLRIVWTALLYILILYIFWYFIFRPENSHDRQAVIFAAGTFFFLCCPVWFYNVERGQIYVLFAFLFTLIFQLYEKQAYWSAGVVIALAVYLRPTFVFLLIPIAVAQHWKIIFGSIIGGSLLSIHAYLHAGLWRGYFDTIKEVTDPDNAVRVANSAYTHSYPAKIEGMTNLTKYKTDFSCGGIPPLQSFLTKPHTVYFFLPILLLAFAIVIFFYWKELARKETYTVILLGFLLYMLAEYIMPSCRTGYNLILWIFPVLLFLQRPNLSPGIPILLITGLCFMNAIPFYFPFFPVLGEALLVFALLYQLKRPQEQALIEPG